VLDARTQTKQGPPPDGQSLLKHPAPFFMARSQQRKDGLKLKRIEPLPLPASLEGSFLQIERQASGEAEDWRVVLRQKGFYRNEDGSYSKR
jgi:hypothetical protein